MNARELKMSDSALLAERDRQKAAKRAKSARLSPRKAPGRDAAKAERKTKAQTNRDTREECMDREDGLCSVRLPASVVGRCAGPLHMDHQWGRGRVPTTVENCRMLCEAHDRKKTDSDPDRATWLRDFQEHCAAYDYPAEWNKAAAALALEEAQHPRPPHPSPAREEQSR